MSIDGTSAHERDPDLPDLVKQAVVLALSRGFETSCLPQQGRLLHLLAQGRPGGLIGETGTGLGVGLAWMVSGADPATRIVSVERDPERASASVQLFAAHDRVEVIHGDCRELLNHGPFDLLVLDGGGSGKQPGDEPFDPQMALNVGGTLVIDDFTPWTRWPPMLEGHLDTARLHWLQHPALQATEVRTGSDTSSIVAIRK
jgi:predicted O-methyltransferase YrrM